MSLSARYNIPSTFYLAPSPSTFLPTVYPITNRFGSMFTTRKDVGNEIDRTVNFKRHNLSYTKMTGDWRAVVNFRNFNNIIISDRYLIYCSLLGKLIMCYPCTTSATASGKSTSMTNSAHIVAIISL